MKLNFKLSAILIALTAIIASCTTQTYADSHTDYWTKCDKETRELVHRTMTFSDSLIKIKDDYKFKQIDDFPSSTGSLNEIFWRTHWLQTLDINCSTLQLNRVDKVARYTKIVQTTAHESWHNYSNWVRKSFLVWKEVNIEAYYSSDTEYNLQFLRWIFWTKMDNIPWFTAKRVQWTKDMYKDWNEEVLADAWSYYILGTPEVQKMLKRVYETCKDTCTNPSFSLVKYDIWFIEKNINWEAWVYLYWDYYINTTYSPDYNKFVKNEVIPFLNMYVWDNSMKPNTKKWKYMKTIESSWLNKFYTLEDYVSQNLSKSLVPSPFNK